MWPPYTVGQYLFVMFLSTNGILLFVLLGLFYDTAIRRSVFFLLCCCDFCRCLRHRSATKVVSQQAAERDTARLVNSAKNERSNESHSNSVESLPSQPGFLVSEQCSSEMLFGDASGSSSSRANNLLIASSFVQIQEGEANTSLAPFRWTPALDSLVNEYHADRELREQESSYAIASGASTRANTLPSSVSGRRTSPLTARTAGSSGLRGLNATGLTHSLPRV